MPYKDPNEKHKAYLRSLDDPNNSITLNCKHCGSSFEKHKNFVNGELRRNPNHNFFCKMECAYAFRTHLKKMQVKCTTCQKDCITDENDLKRNKNFYCSKECYQKKRNLGKVLVELLCPQCNQIFYNSVNKLNGKKRKGYKAIYCSLKCSTQALKNDYSKWFTVKCDQCGNDVQRQGRQLKITGLHFCTPSCKGKYFAKLNMLGAQRSQLELKLEEHIKTAFPNLKFNINDRDILGGLELDFYFPELQLGIEVNGPAHYTSIWGDEALLKIQRNDIIKKNYCKKKNIRLLELTETIHPYKDNSLEIFENHVKPVLDGLSNFLLDSPIKSVKL